MLTKLLRNYAACERHLFNQSAPYSGGSRPSDKGGPSHPDPEMGGGGVQKEFFWPFGPQIGLKKRGGPSPPGTSPRSATAIERGVFAIAMIYHGGNYSGKNFRSDSPIYMDICYLEKMSLLTIVWINADFSHRN